MTTIVDDFFKCCTFRGVVQTLSVPGDNLNNDWEEEKAVAHLI